MTRTRNMTRLVAKAIRIPEAEIQKAVIKARNYNRGQYPALTLLAGSGNGERRDRAVNPNTGKEYSPAGAKLQAMGLLPGFPDLQLPCPRRGYTGCAIELKAYGGTLQDEQIEILAQLAGEGWLSLCIECNDWAIAWNVLCWYLGYDTLIQPVQFWPVTCYHFCPAQPIQVTALYGEA